MANVIVLHGTGGSPEDFWFPYLKNALELKGHKVWVPQLPDPEHPSVENWLPFVLNSGEISAETVLVGHSAGCPLILSILENISVKIAKAILVAGFAYYLDPKVEDPIVQKSYNWHKIREHAKSIIMINSDNDPWGCNDKAGRYIFDNIGGTLIIRHGEGHMGSLSYNQPYREFPLLVDLIESNGI
ncbi:MAG: RBBP9/YdeN family alpha/beta hydrolase [Bdellovibrionota bacterium]|jgi:predicted alpha/beta hydrolase family esterase